MCAKIEFCDIPFFDLPSCLFTTTSKLSLLHIKKKYFNDRKFPIYNFQQNAKPEDNITTEVADNRKAKQEKPESKCNSSSLKFSHCIWREMQLSCPKDLVRNTKACDRMRERLQKKEYPDFDRRGRPNRPSRPEKPNNTTITQ